MSDRLTDLAIELADEAARSDIECMCLSVREDGGKIQTVEQFVACWYDTKNISDEEDRGCVDRAIEYLDSREVLTRHPDVPSRVQFRAASEMQTASSMNLHPDTCELVMRFSDALAEKLSAAEQKYGYTNGWKDPSWMHECRRQLLHHIEKGDPRDVAAYCAFLWHHGESTSTDSMTKAMREVAEEHAHGLALELECILADNYSGKWYDSALNKLAAYREAMNTIHERQSPTFMGEPVLLKDATT